MVTWNNKLVTVLSGGNVIKFTNNNDFEEFKNLMKKIGLDFSKYFFKDLLEESRYVTERYNKPYTLEHAILVGYSNGRGFEYGFASEESAEDWYGMPPFTWQEIKKELR